MVSIVVVFPKYEDSRNIKNILVRKGFSSVFAEPSGAQALSQLDNLNYGVVLCSYKMVDMMYTELYECLPEGFDMVLMASDQLLARCEQDNIVRLGMPLKMNDLISTLDMMIEAIERKRKAKKNQPKVRSMEERLLISQAKEVLMERNHLSEEEAHRYIQKTSMDSGCSMKETAGMILSMMKD